MNRTQVFLIYALATDFPDFVKRRDSRRVHFRSIAKALVEDHYLQLALGPRSKSHHSSAKSVSWQFSLASVSIDVDVDVTQRSHATHTHRHRSNTMTALTEHILARCCFNAGNWPKSRIAAKIEPNKATNTQQFSQFWPRTTKPT